MEVEMDKKFGAVHRAVLMLERFGCFLPSKHKNQFSNTPQRYYVSSSTCMYAEDVQYM